MYYARHRRARGSTKRRVTAALICLLLLMIVLAARMRPLIDRAAEQQARQVFTQAVNDAVSQVMAEEQITYEDLVQLTYNPSGEVVAVRSNSIAVSRLTAALSRAVQNKIMDGLRDEIGVPVGTLTGVSFLVGRGPEVKVRIKPNGAINSRLSARFSDAGINQSLYSVDCDISGRMYVMMSGFKSNIEISTNINVIQTVIVGRVPESYTSITASGDDLGDTIDKVFDRSE